MRCFLYRINTDITEDNVIVSRKEVDQGIYLGNVDIRGEEIFGGNEYFLIIFIPHIITHEHLSSLLSVVFIPGNCTLQRVDLVLDNICRYIIPNLSIPNSEY